MIEDICRQSFGIIKPFDIKCCLVQGQVSLYDGSIIVQKTIDGRFPIFVITVKTIIVFDQLLIYKSGIF